jgi:hypothetical protein
VSAVEVKSDIPTTLMTTAPRAPLSTDIGTSNMVVTSIGPPNVGGPDVKPARVIEALPAGIKARFEVKMILEDEANDA